jgi:hypothetical protein
MSSVWEFVGITAPVSSKVLAGKIVRHLTVKPYPDVRLYHGGAFQPFGSGLPVIVLPEFTLLSMVNVFDNDYLQVAPDLLRTSIALIVEFFER